MPDWNETPADTKKENRQNLNIQQRRPLTPRKFPARCHCLSKQYQITSYPRNNSEETATQGKHSKPTPRKENPDKSRTIKAKLLKLQSK